MEIVKGPNNSHEELLAHMVAQYEVALLRTCYMYLRDRGLAEFVMNLTIAMETKGHASAAELHPIPNSEIVRRFRKGVGQEKAIPGCE